MVGVLVDSSLLAVPNYASNAQEADCILNRVFHLAEIVQPEIPLDTFIISEDEDYLWASNVGPDYGQIEQFLDMVGLEEVFSPADLMKSYVSIFDHCQRLSFSDLKGEADYINFHCSIGKSLGPQALRDLTKRGSEAVTLLNDKDKSFVLFSAFSDESLDHIVCHREKAPVQQGDSVIQPLPQAVAVPLITKLSDLATPVYSLLAWRAAYDSREVGLAIALGACAINKGLPVGSPLFCSHFSIGSDFFASLETFSAVRDGKFSSATLLACCRVVAGLAGHVGKPFGKPSQEVRPRDQADAWRVHVSKAGAAVRLMYWRLSEMVEFSNVGNKWEELILSGKAKQELAVDLRQFALS